MDSLTEQIAGVPCENVAVEGSRVSLEAPSVGGRLRGTLGPDGNAIEGTCSQGQELALRLTRESAPEGVGALQAVIDRDLAGAVGPGAALVIGVVQGGKRAVWAYGEAKADSLFEIGSVPKTFTGLLLARMVGEGKARLDEPVGKREGPEVGLLDLATQHSGLRRLPDNLHPAKASDPYDDYGAAELYAFLKKQGLGLRP